MASAWGLSWGRSWANTWGKVGGQDTHDGAGAEHWYKYWRKLHEKKKKPTIEEIVEVVLEKPKTALQTVKAQVKERYPDIDYRSVKQNAEMALFVAQQLMIVLEMRRIEDENDENDAIMLLLM